MDYKFQDLIDISKLQELLDSLNETVTLVTAITDNESNVLAATGRQDICTKFHQVNPVTEQQCRESDLYMFGHINENKPVVTYKCLNEMVESGTPIIIGGKHVGNVYISQFFFEKPDLEVFRNRAKQFGFDEKSYMEAVDKVPVRDRGRLERRLTFIR
jgi:ligand-binding sensor protein